MLYFGKTPLFSGHKHTYSEAKFLGRGRGLKKAYRREPTIEDILIGLAGQCKLYQGSHEPLLMKHAEYVISMVCLWSLWCQHSYCCRVSNRGDTRSRNLQH